MRVRSQERGFTLIELMVVVALIGIVAALAVPNLTQMQRNASLAAEARILVGAYMEAQALSLSSSNRTRLFLSKEHRRWAVQVDNNGDGTCETTVSSHNMSAGYLAFGPDGVTNPFDAPFDGIPHDAWCTVCGANDGEIRFDPEGKSEETGAVFLHRSDKPAGHAYAVVFIGPVGNVRLFRVTP